MPKTSIHQVILRVQYMTQNDTPKYRTTYPMFPYANTMIHLNLY